MIESESTVHAHLEQPCDDCDRCGCQGEDVRDRVVFGCLPAGRLCNDCLWWVEDNKEDMR